MEKPCGKNFLAVTPSVTGNIQVKSNTRNFLLEVPHKLYETATLSFQDSQKRGKAEKKRKKRRKKDVASIFMLNKDFLKNRRTTVFIKLIFRLYNLPIFYNINL